MDERALKMVLAAKQLEIDKLKRKVKRTVKKAARKTKRAERKATRKTNRTEKCSIFLTITFNIY